MRLFNSLTKAKEDFVPLEPANVRLYVCGPTVYDNAHIGNARPAIVFDLLFRLLRHEYGAEHVSYVRNITDVDDKINARAKALGIEIGDLTKKTAAQYQADMLALKCLAPTHEPRVTDNIPEIIRLIERLILVDAAYSAGGHVLFSTAARADYGNLARRSIDQMRAGARIEIAPYKRDEMDFVLWKPSEESMPGWNSPWGFGRPGWHIECSAMADRYLGETFDIHGGGVDLVFPHHENEIAQSECAHGGKTMARFWMHNGTLSVNGEKMAKSAGNVLTVMELLKDWRGAEIRLAMLRSHYRHPINFSLDGLKEAAKTLEKWERKIVGTTPVNPSDDFLDSLRGDLNTPAALAKLHAANAQELANGMHFLSICS